MDTNEVIANQLAENTGIAVMDSGGARGRMWQRNQDRAAALDMSITEMFEARPTVYWDGWMVIVDTYHWMTERLDHRPDLQERFDRWVRLGWLGLERYADGPYTNSTSTVDDYIERMVARGWMERHPEFGDGWTNTYNHDNILSQDLLFRLAAYTDDHPLGSAEVVFMSTHNGADARGGYSDFKIYECDSYEMFDWDSFSAYCPQCHTEPADPNSTLFDETPYVRRDSGVRWHRSGEWDAEWSLTADQEPVIDPRWPGHNRPALELPDDFEQTGPICPIHLCNMELSA